MNPVEQWDEYASLFASHTSRFQAELYEYAASQLAGSVLDCGCGVAKLAPYLLENSDVCSYTGVDNSPGMITLARELIGKLNRPDYKVECQSIEASTGRYSSAVSLQSHYAWADGLSTLRHIREQLKPEGRFVLATANANIDIERLLELASRENLMSPGWDRFAELNRAFATTQTARFLTLDELIDEARTAGFSVCDTRTDFYLGGLNCLLLAH